MKASKKCPKCNGTEIYTNEGLTKRGERAAIGFSSWGRFFISTYICLNCGFLEEYVEEKDLKDPKKMAKFKSNWKQV